jgi:hypothetical protein
MFVLYCLKYCGFVLELILGTQLSILEPLPPRILGMTFSPGPRWSWPEKSKTGKPFVRLLNPLFRSLRLHGYSLSDRLPLNYIATPVN